MRVPRHPFPLILCLALSAVVHLIAPRLLPAQPLLSCGVPVEQRLAPAAVDVYRVQVSEGSMVSIDVRDDMGVLGLVKLRASGPGGVQETCSGTIMVSAPGETLVEVSDCIGSDSGFYTLTASVVADTPDNCGIPLPCGTLPSIFDLAIQGEVDSFVFDGTVGERVTLRAVDRSGTIGFVRQRVFGPNGVLLTGADSCATTTRVVDLQQTGLHTVLVSACGLPNTGQYALSSERPSCPAGPEITYFGLARADSRPAPPTEYDDFGRAMYKIAAGSGFYMVVEASPGRNGVRVGFDAFDYDPTDPRVLPDLQVLFSQQLGNGSLLVCDTEAGMQGGVPAAVPFEFVEVTSVSDAINDFGCRVNDGSGNPQGVGENDACTQFTDGSFHFVEPDTTLQFCAPIAAAWTFTRGVTVVKARVRDAGGVVGAEREIVVQVGTTPTEVPTPRPTGTPTPSRTPFVDPSATPTASRTGTGAVIPTTPPSGTTPTPTPTTALDGCPCDCSGDDEVTIDEVVQGMTILMGLSDVETCPAADVHGDGSVTVDEIILGVRSALNGCDTENSSHPPKGRTKP